MKQRPGVGGKPSKTRRRERVTSKRSSGPKAARGPSPSVADLQEQLDVRTRELNEALEQQTATAEVLRVISSSPGELQAVFTSILENATRICEASFGILALYEGGLFRIGARHNTPPALAEFRQREPVFHLGPLVPLARVVATKQLLHISDCAEEPAYKQRDADFAPFVELSGARTLLIVPMLKENELIGVINVYRREVRPFTDKQIALVTSFAAQAVIAVENARLLNELRQRTDDLTESLEQQTATSEVLRVISSSPGELAPVFDALLENATRLCQAQFAGLFLSTADGLRNVATHGGTSPIFDLLKRAPALLFSEHHPHLPIIRAAQTKEVVHITDVFAEPSYIEHDPNMVRLVESTGARTLLIMPMLKEDELVGVIGTYRQEVRPFTEKQIELLRNFADQAVIAIENARLLHELRQRTTDLTESLERQTATSEVLEVISNSPGELEPVYNAILENAARICEAKFGGLQLYENGSFRVGALHNAPPAFAALRQREPLYRPDPLNPLARVAATKKLLHISDMTEDEAYKQREAHAVAFVDLSGTRTVLAVPMLREAEVVGVIAVFRQEIRPFTDKQIALLQNFAAQAVIAIENARLLNELRELNQNLEQRVADQVGEIERMGRLRRFLPPQVADLIVASGNEKQLESHRREITALFCDLRGFTGFSESADPEDVMALLREYHAAIGDSIVKYSGTLERYAGDGVMVVFNDPVPVENPALQAVFMALEMRDAIASLTQTWRRWGHDIGFGIGIAHGFATLGTIGFEGRFDYAAIGTVSNVASRLCDEAKPGQILISPRVLTKVESAVRVELVGEFELKGIRRPLAAYNVLGTEPAN